MTSLRQIIAADARLGRLTPEAVAEILAAIELQPKQGLPWLVRAMQGALFASLTPANLSGNRRANHEIRDELFAAAKPLSEAVRLISQRSREFDNAVWDASYHGFHPEGLADEPPDHRTYTDAIHHIEWLAVFLRRAGMMLETQKPQWTRAALLEERICRAQCLSSVYAMAFDREPTVNTWETAKDLGPWSWFYQETVSLVFGEHATPNLLEVLKEARRRDRLERVLFVPGDLSD